jgi:hypothetical protein
MNIAYLICAHTNADQLLRLIDRLRDEHADFFIHVDKKCDFSIFHCLFPQKLYPNVNFTKRENGSWGRIGIVKGILHALKVIVSSDKNYDYIILLSGQDYPVKSNAYIRDYLKRNSGKIFMEYFKLPCEGWNTWMDRIEQYHFVFRGESYIYPPGAEIKTYKDKLLNKLFELYFPLPRRFPANLKPFGGSAWWAIPRNAAIYILNFTKKHPEYMRYHENTLLPDEIFFQTIFLNSQNKNIIDNLTGKNLHYIDWKYKKDPASPKTLQEEDIHYLLDTDKLFARKFDINIDSKILELLDDRRCRGEMS